MLTNSCELNCIPYPYGLGGTVNRFRMIRGFFVSVDRITTNILYT